MNVDGTFFHMEESQASYYIGILGGYREEKDRKRTDRKPPKTTCYA